MYCTLRCELLLCVTRRATVQGRSAPWIHTDEGDDDMPGHVKSSMFGVSLNIPITKGKLNLGTWQVSRTSHLTQQQRCRLCELLCCLHIWQSDNLLTLCWCSLLHVT